MSIRDGLRAMARYPTVRSPTNLMAADLVAVGCPVDGTETSETFARKLSAVDRCIELLSDSMAKLPAYCVDRNTRERVTLPVLEKLNGRPNEAMTPSIRKKLLETSRLVYGNGYDWVVRDPRTAAIQELIPIPGNLVHPWHTMSGEIYYTVTNPYSGEPFTLSNADVCHYKGATRNGLEGVSVLQRASEVISSSRARQQHDLSYYENGGQPSGVLKTDADLSGVVDDPKNPGQLIGRKDLLRREWERIHAGPKNSHRLAILDYGLTYQSISTTNRDAQFIESQEVAIRDIARYFGVPLYKLQEGKQAYGSNEQNAIEYVVGTLHPIVTQYEEEQTYKLLFFSEQKRGLELRMNMMVELRGDNSARSAWYKTMREIGVFSINDVLRLEDMPDVEGGNERMVSLNFAPLSQWQINDNPKGG